MATPTIVQNVMDFFRPATAPVTPAPSGNQTPGTGLPSTTQTGKTDANGVVPKDAQGNPLPGDKQKDPNDPLAGLDVFKDLWTPIPDDKKPKAPENMFTNLDPGKVMEAAAAVDFSKKITPEIMAKVVAGGPEAGAEFVKALNTVAQQVYGQSGLATAKIVEAALKQAREQFMSELPALVRSHAVTDGVNTDHPAMANPALAPVVEALKQQMIIKNPTATAAEIKRTLNDYFTAMGAVFGNPGDKGDTSTSKGKGGTKGKGADIYDFSSFLVQDQNTGS